MVRLVFILFPLILSTGVNSWAQPTLPYAIDPILGNTAPGKVIVKRILCQRDSLLHGCSCENLSFQAAGADHFIVSFLHPSTNRAWFSSVLAHGVDSHIYPKLDEYTDYYFMVIAVNRFGETRSDTIAHPACKHK